MTIVQNVLPQPSETLLFDGNPITQEPLEKIKSLMLLMSPELWQASQEALAQNNNNLFKRQLTPKTEQCYEVFKTLKSLLKVMKATSVGDTGVLIDAKKAIEAWQSLPIPFPVPENHALQIYCYYQAAMPDPDDIPELQTAWQDMGHILSLADISKTALSAPQENLIKTINALKFKASGTAMKHFIRQGWVDDKLKIAVPKKAIMGKNFISAEVWREIVNQHSQNKVQNILQKHHEETIEIPLYLAALMQDNISLMRHYAIPLLPVKPKEGTCKICASVIIDLTQKQELNHKGVDIRHDTAIRIAKQANLWNFCTGGLLARSVATHLVLSGNHNTSNLIGNMIDYWAIRGIKIEESALLKNGSLIQEVYYKLAHRAKEENRTPEQVDQVLSDATYDKANYRATLNILKRLAARAPEIGIAIPDSQEYVRLQQDTLSRAAEHISRARQGVSAPGAAYLSGAYRALQQAGVKLPIFGITKLKEAFSSLAKQEQEKGGELFTLWCDLLTSSAIKVATLTHGENWAEQTSELIQAQEQMSKQDARQQIFTLATNLLSDPNAAVISYLTLEAFSKNPAIIPDTWRQQRVLSWTPPSETFNRQVGAALEDAQLRQNKAAPTHVTDTGNVPNISF